jgi:hypothetical protein
MQKLMMNLTSFPSSTAIAFCPLNLDRITALPRDPVGLFALGMINYRMRSSFFLDANFFLFPIKENFEQSQW